MRITKTFTSKHYNNFFWSEGDKLGVCKPFVKNFITVSKTNDSAAVITLSTINPKKKEFKSVKRTDTSKVMLGEKTYDVCYSERIQLDNVDIKVGDTFWLKVVRL